MPDCTTTVYESSVTAAPFRGCDHTNIGMSMFCDLENNDMNPPMWAQMVQDEFIAENEPVPEYAMESSEKLSNIREQSVNPDSIKEMTLKQHFIRKPTYNAFEKDIAVIFEINDHPLENVAVNQLGLLEHISITKTILFW